MKRIILILLMIIILIGIATILPEEKLSEKLKIGVSDDISGFVVDYMLKEEKLDSNEELEAYFIKDC